MTKNILFSTKSICVMLVALFVGLIFILEWSLGPNYRPYLGVLFTFLIVYLLVSGLWEACTRVPSDGEDN